MLQQTFEALHVGNVKKVTTISDRLDGIVHGELYTVVVRGSRWAYGGYAEYNWSNAQVFTFKRARHGEKYENLIS